MFNIGDKVSWQQRNMNDTTRGSNSFHSYNGVITQLNEEVISVEYRWTRNSIDVFTATKNFRKLRNGKWIASNENRDDPKGRLYLTIEELETAE
jgi:hypothetical protein